MKHVVCVDAVIEYEGRIVLVERRDGKLALPGGKKEVNESLEQALQREVREETGLRINPDYARMIGVYSKPGRDPRWPSVSVAYMIINPAGELKAGSDAKKVVLKKIETLDERLAFDHDTILEDYKSCKLL